METCNNVLPKIIAIEGIDGSGKTLQFQMLENKLTSLGKKCLCISFPIYEGFFGKEIGTMLSGKNKNSSADVVDAKSMALWYVVDRWKKFSEIDYSSFDYILLNRYVLSNAVYQSIRYTDGSSDDFVKWVFKLEHEQFGLPKPDTYILLDVNEQISKENVIKKGFREYTGDQPDVYENSSNFLFLVRERYLQFSKEIDNIFVINCIREGKMENPDTIHSDIISILKNQFTNK